MIKIIYFLLSGCYLLYGNSVDANVTVSVPKKTMTVKEKKEMFFTLVVPAVQKVHEELTAKYNQILIDINTSTDKNEISKLKELLIRTKPHPQSIVIAQAAMESGWATSRFFREANNLFGIWSTNKYEKRIAANEKRGGTRTIWLRKFDTVDECIRAYYKLIATSKAYKNFRKVRFETNNPYEIVKQLDKYSEIGKKYPQELAKVIHYNKLTKYDK